MSLDRWSFLRVADGPSSAVDLLQWLLACLRAQYWNYQQAHWQTMGPTYYGNHLLFQRLYEGVVEQVDTLAEKMVGLYGVESVDSSVLARKFSTWVSRWSSVDCHHERGLLSEREFQRCCRDTYDHLKAAGQLSLGLDDFLMATASEHEANQYLLQQVLRTKDAGAEWARMAASPEE